MLRRLGMLLPALILMIVLPLCALADASGSPMLYESASVSKGQRVVLFSGESSGKLVWASSNKAVASVSSSGRVSGRKAGCCVITATASDGKVYQCTLTVTQPVTKVAVPARATLERGKTLALAPVIKPANATDKTLTYTSSNAAVASVSTSGVISANKAGSAVITVTAQSGKKDTIRITVTQPVTSVSLDRSSAVIERGKRLTLAASVAPADATDKKLTFTSSDKKIASVSSRGVVTAKKAGTCVITAKSKNGLTASCTVTVTQPVTKVTVPARATLERGKTLALAPVIKPSNATDKTLTYTSSNAAAASVSPSGVISANKAGSAVITVTAQSGRKDTIRITVTQPVTGVSLDQPSAVIERGKRLTLAASVAPADATDKKLTFTSSDKKIASVSSRGVVTAKKAGVCVITAKSKNGLTASCTITVTQPVTSVNLGPSRKTLSRNTTFALTPAIKPANATDQTLVYHSSNPAVASVDENGVISARADGQAVVTATAKSGKKDTVRITVKSTPVTGLTIDRYCITLNIGEAAAVTASVSPADASERGVRYSSSDPSVATVDTNGRITAVAPGSVSIIAASVEAPGKTASCRVFVRDPNSSGRLDGLIIGINPGHQVKGDYRKDPLAPGSKKTGNRVGEGCAGVKTRAYEYEVNLQVSLMLRDRLEAEGATVVMTRTSNDVNISNINRAKMLNEAGAHLALQIHCNSSPIACASTNGIELYVKPTDAAAKNAAGSIMDHMVAQTGANNRRIRTSEKYMSLNWSETPSILVELGYMSNPKEDVLLSTPAYQLKLVEGMYEGIAEYFGR